MATVWVVTFNGLVQRVCGTRESAHEVMTNIRASDRYRHEQWREVGPDGWSSRLITNLRASEWVVVE